MTYIAMHHTDLKAEITAFQAVVAPAAKPHLTFATVWPAAREALVLLGTLIPASLRMILMLVFSVGDTVAATSAVRPA